MMPVACSYFPNKSAEPWKVANYLTEDESWSTISYPQDTNESYSSISKNKSGYWLSLLNEGSSQEVRISTIKGNHFDEYDFLASLFVKGLQFSLKASITSAKLLEAETNPIYGVIANLWKTQYHEKTQNELTQLEKNAAAIDLLSTWLECESEEEIYEQHQSLEVTKNNLNDNRGEMRKLFL